MTRQYESAKKYLDEELFPCRAQWAWAYTAYKFTCGVRTNGRVEGENRVNKTIGGPKKSLKQVFDGLNERTDGQVFPGPLQIIRTHVGPYGLQVCFKQMQESVYYRTKVLQLPEGMHDWHMMNTFENDEIHISTRWLIRLIRDRGLSVQHLYRVESIGGQSLHMIAILSDGNYACDCCMGTNLGLPCRHYFQVLSSMPTLKFSLGIIRPRCVIYCYEITSLSEEIDGIKIKTLNLVRSLRLLPVKDKHLVRSNYLESIPNYKLLLCRIHCIQQINPPTQHLHQHRQFLLELHSTKPMLPSDH
ncbi:hypothetical protein CPB83DRAFT_776724 [Crepidotus variabilis]|uniref:SWIM-type domain-containing protein n=1 Tax=Crepidotus variabilis TaxID=179855 RepID=A0A9P6E585_9AGAR|nr:hypothetical protein CPB83DRAFT_776724 [Crepidotus variabilis]